MVSIKVQLFPKTTSIEYSPDMSTINSKGEIVSTENIYVNKDYDFFNFAPGISASNNNQFLLCLNKNKNYRFGILNIK